MRPVKSIRQDLDKFGISVHVRTYVHACSQTVKSPSSRPFPVKSSADERARHHGNGRMRGECISSNARSLYFPRRRYKVERGTGEEKEKVRN